MTTDQLISQLVTALRDMTPTQHSSWCMEHEGGVVDGPDGRRVGVGPLIVGTCCCDAKVQAARAALDAAALDEQEPDAFRRFRHCLEFDEDAPIEAVIEAAIRRLDYDLHLVTENSRLREACTLALGIMEQKNRVTVLPTAKFVDVKFAPEDIAVLRAALEKKP